MAASVMLRSRVELLAAFKTPSTHGAMFTAAMNAPEPEEPTHGSSQAGVPELGALRDALAAGRHAHVLLMPVIMPRGRYVQSA